MNAIIVEDEVIVSMDLKLKLGKVGVEVLGVENNYKDAIETFDKHNPNIAFLDINIIGEKTGLDVAKTIRSKNKKTCLVFITAFSSDEIISQIQMLDPQGYINKPFSIEQLQEVLANCSKKLNQ